ncbi:class IIb bacteriocin, lactobin A/cerein 7B family [Aquimarina brevivitae]|uniref:Lactobin A/cerein 7B family class IIb bacteriocin n=1 Tax=Aquimarina brevivitae TaxID=323412 RepID=A0A4Q7PG25_9FLAO|nr:class IIb bacteriocin, lactobin A/cerein 7B family [Aquimarina brevivitae]RZS99436.1 lactobin A/cerein 7B family class IIb bacteriocin [Aquimarina brevivitae]
MNLEKQEKGAEFLQSLTQKAWESEEFKNRLINDPVATIEEFTGKDLSDLKGKKVVVTDQTSEDVVYINLPAKPNMDELELTEEQLEQVAGGITPTVTYVAGVAVGVGVCWLVDEYIND